MFTGIIEQMVKVMAIKKAGNNVHISCKSEITNELRIDQSIAHNGVCLTVVDVKDDIYIVTAIKETLDKSNLGLSFAIKQLIDIASEMSFESLLYLDQDTYLKTKSLYHLFAYNNYYNDYVQEMYL